MVLNKKLLKDLATVTDFCHTGKIEVYHSMMLKYASKREHYSYQGMVGSRLVGGGFAGDSYITTTRVERLSISSLCIVSVASSLTFFDRLY